MTSSARWPARSETSGRCPTPSSTPSPSAWKRYTLTERGRQALEQWRHAPIDDTRVELRDLSLLKLNLGADPAALATDQLRAHQRKLAEYERRRAEDPGTPPRGPWLTLDAGIAHEREWIRFWANLTS
jgi:PadR family transcriptional regulator AphA